MSGSGKLGSRPAAAFDVKNNFTGPLPNIVEISFAVMREYPISSPLHDFGCAVTFFFPALALLVVIFRLISRRMTKQYGWDDTLIIMALVVSIVGTVPMYMYMKVNFQGIHRNDIPKLYYPYNGPGFFCIWLVQIFFPTAVYLVKSSFICYITPLGASKPGFVWACRVLQFITVGCMFAMLGGTIFQTFPVERMWYRTVPGKTMYYPPFVMTMNGMNILTDFASLALPIWIFNSLRYHWRAKLALIVVFSLGLLVTAVSIVRLYFLYKIFYAPTMEPVTIGTLVYPIEACLAIITVSVPPLWPLARRWFPNVFARLGISRPFQQDQLREITQVTYLGQQDSNTDLETASKKSSLLRMLRFKKSSSTVKLNTKERAVDSWPSQSSVTRGPPSRGAASEIGVAVPSPPGWPTCPLTKRNTDIMSQFEEQRQQSNEHYRRIWGRDDAPEAADPYHMHVREQARTDKFGV